LAPAGLGLLAAGVDARDLAALTAALPDFAIRRRLADFAAARLTGILTSGDQRHDGRARRRATALQIPLLRFGPGLLRAPPGWRSARSTLSVTALAITGPSSSADILNADRLLATSGWESPELLAKAADLRGRLVSRRLGGPWWKSKLDAGLPRGGYALIDLGEGGWAGASGSPSPAAVNAILAAARAQYTSHQTVILAPSDERRRDLPPGYLAEPAAKGCIILPGMVDIWQALDGAETVYTAGGETGFLALLAGAKVCCFGDSFYSGWGITADEAGVPQKALRRTIEEVFAGTSLLATRYVNPYHQKAADFEEILEILGEWQKIEAVNREVAVCLGMAFWKRRQIRDFLRSGVGKPVFRRTTAGAVAVARQRKGGIAVWASRAPEGLTEAAEMHQIPLFRVEDGFIRSVGLGSDFIPAASLVLDRRGMHFDPSVRSGLEELLAESEFDAALIARARDLITHLVARGITKYNVGTSAVPIEWPAGNRRILVPGQVEDDLSVRLGGAGITRNLDLLARVRETNAGAFILYKPHPDVEAGHREGKIADELVTRFADAVVRNVSTAVILSEIDELHTLTSLAGFEALLRGRRVVVYGRPFYAGWGLTTDLAATDRGRRLTLEELVAGALILYPRYLDPVTQLPCKPELLIDRLAHAEVWRPGSLVLARRLQGLMTKHWSETMVRSTKLFAKFTVSPRS
jgi:capsular polysaccharide export protein